jgi:acetoin utilization deacetylase AcuC-like enzyme
VGGIVRAFFSHHTFELPATHTFPMEKYALLRERLVGEGTLDARRIEAAHLASRDEITSAHTAAYYDRFVLGQLARQEQLRLGLPWSQALVRRSLASVGATLDAAYTALADGVAVHLGGGTHHAFADHGEGFCVFNDIAVAVRVLRARGRVGPAAIIDCDVHHGNGTAALFAGDAETYTLSLHGARNYPLVKPPSTVDVALADGTRDAEYLHALDVELARLFTVFAPDIAFYQAGVDPYGDDRLGRLGLSLDGLAARDRRVLQACLSRGVACVVTLGGGYARDVRDTVEAHCNTVRAARRLCA